MAIYQNDSVKLYYETYQPQSNATTAPWIVFLNGMSQTTLNWKSLCRALQDKANILVYDARGQGQSEVGDATLTLQLHADDLTGLLTHLNIERANLAGFSHGARIALAVAAYHAHRLDRLLLCSATASPTALARTTIRAWREVLRLGGLEAMSWMSLPSILGDRFLQDNEALLAGIIKASIKRNSNEGLIRLLDAMMDYPDLSELAGQIYAPTLVLSASHDPLVQPSGAKELAKLCQGRHILVPNCGHTIPIETPEVFKSHVIDFFKL